MIKKILVALDSSARSERSLPWVRMIAPQAETVLLQVVDPAYWSEINPSYQNREVLSATKFLNRLSEGFSPAAKVIVEDGPTGPTILAVADRVRARMIALTTEGRCKPSQRIHGGVAEQMFQCADLPLLIVPSHDESSLPAQIKKIVVLLDGSELSELILPLAQTVAQEHEAKVVLVDAWNTSDAPLENRLDQIRSDFSAIGVNTDARVAHGELTEVIQSTCEAEEADMVFMSAQDHGGAARLMLGGTVTRLVRELKVPIVVVKHAAMRKLMSMAMESARALEA